jgi:hypothetical protein
MNKEKETKSTFIIVRVTPTEKERLEVKAGGRRKLSKYIRGKLELEV